DAGGRQSGKDRDGVDKALVEDAEYDVDHHDRRQQQPALAAQRLLKHLRRPGETGGDGRRGDQPSLHVLNAADGLAEGDTRRQVEGDGHGRKLTLMVDRQGACDLGQGRDRAERHQLTGARPDEDLGEVVRILLEYRIVLQDHRIVVAGGVDGRYLSRAERVVEGGTDLLGREAQRRRLLSVDVENGLRALDLQIRGDVLQRGQLADFGLDERRKPEYLVAVARLPRVLI